MVSPDIEEALAALDRELGSRAEVRLAPADRPRRYNKAPSVRWSRVAEWCRDHPGMGFTATVHKNAVTRFRTGFPDLRVEGSDHRRDPDTGKQVVTLFAVYEPPPPPPPKPKRKWQPTGEPVRIQPRRSRDA